ncbi:Htaa protein [Prauserella sp. Am3]|nr:Htaa protein [Prauserella sp. Am3]
MGDPQPGLTWGLKRSFVAYVARLRDGGCGAKDGGSVVDGSYFHFEPAEPVETAGSDESVRADPNVLRYRGDVRLVGHAGLLYVMLYDPWIEFTDGGARLTVVDIEHWPDTTRRTPLAELAPAEPVVEAGLRVWRDVPAVLTEDGRELFNEQYETGQPLDPVTFTAAGVDHP